MFLPLISMAKLKHTKCFQWQTIIMEEFKQTKDFPIWNVSQQGSLPISQLYRLSSMYKHAFNFCASLIFYVFLIFATETFGEILTHENFNWVGGCIFMRMRTLIAYSEWVQISKKKHVGCDTFDLYYFNIRSSGRQFKMYLDRFVQNIDWPLFFFPILFWVRLLLYVLSAKCVMCCWWMGRKNKVGKRTTQWHCETFSSWLDIILIPLNLSHTKWCLNPSFFFLPIIQILKLGLYLPFPDKHVYHLCLHLLCCSYFLPRRGDPQVSCVGKRPSGTLRVYPHSIRSPQINKRLVVQPTLLYPSCWLQALLAHWCKRWPARKALARLHVCLTNEGRVWWPFEVAVRRRSGCPASQLVGGQETHWRKDPFQWASRGPSMSPSGGWYPGQGGTGKEPVYSPHGHGPQSGGEYAVLVWGLYAVSCQKSDSVTFLLSPHLLSEQIICKFCVVYTLIINMVYV